MGEVIALKGTDGNVVYIVKRWITRVTKPTQGQYPINTRALVYMGNVAQAVEETPEQVVHAIEGHE